MTTTKADIRNQFKLTLGRNDCTDELANTFIEQAVSRIQRTLRVPAMERISPYVTSFDQDSILIPDDFLSLRYFYSGTDLLEYIDIGRYLPLAGCVGAPMYYTRIGGEFKMAPKPQEDTSLTLVYYGEVPDLVNDTDTNFLCAIAPDLLIYGALCFAADYWLDDRKQAFEEAFTRIYKEVLEQALLVEMETSGMAIRSTFDNLEY